MPRPEEPKLPQPKSPEQKPMTEIVWEEMQEPPGQYTEEYWSLPENRAYWHLGNFYSKLPSTIAANLDEHVAKTKTGAPINLDNIEFARNHSLKDLVKRSKGVEEPWRGDKEEMDTWGYSPKRWEGTGAEFERDIAQAIEASGVDKQELKNYITELGDGIKDRDRILEMRLILPVYIKLREMGYFHRDLM